MELGLQLELVKRNQWRSYGINPLSSFSFLGDNIFQTGLKLRNSYLTPKQRVFYWQTGLSLIFPPAPYNPVIIEEPIDDLKTGLIESKLGLGLMGKSVTGYLIEERTIFYSDLDINKDYTGWNNSIFPFTEPEVYQLSIGFIPMVPLLQELWYME